MPKIPCAVVSGNRKNFSCDSGMLFLCRGLAGGTQGVVLHDGAGGIQTGAQTQGQRGARTAGRHVQTQDAPGPEGQAGKGRGMDVRPVMPAAGGRQLAACSRPGRAASSRQAVQKGRQCPGQAWRRPCSRQVSQGREALFQKVRARPQAATRQASPKAAGRAAGGSSLARSSTQSKLLSAKGSQSGDAASISTPCGALRRACSRRAGEASQALRSKPLCQSGGRTCPAPQPMTSSSLPRRGQGASMESSRAVLSGRAMC